jgi:hypothetical protein
MTTLNLEDSGRKFDTLTTRTWNMYAEPTPQGPTKSRRYPRPGLMELFSVGDGPIRAVFPAPPNAAAGDNFITVSGADVYWNATVVGTVSADGPVRFATDADDAVIVVDGSAYTVTTSAVTKIADADLPAVRDVFCLNQRFGYVHDDNSGQFSWAALGDPTSIDGLAFATAESNPDVLLGCAVLGEYVYFFGSKSTELWYGQSDLSAPFIRSKGRTYSKGVCGRQSICEADNSLFWVGNDRMIYRSSAVPIRISSFALEDRLRFMSSTQLNAITSFRTVFSGHTFIVYNLPGQGSWAFDVGMKTWDRWTTWDQEDLFRVDCGQDDLLGDRLTGKVVSFLWNEYEDLGDPIERIVSAFIPVEAGVIRHANLVLHCSKGVGRLSGEGQAPVVEMRFSDEEGSNFTNWSEAPLGHIGDRSKGAAALWLALGSMRAPGRLLEFRCSDSVFFSPYAVAYNESRL